MKVNPALWAARMFGIVLFGMVEHLYWERIPEGMRSVVPARYPEQGLALGLMGLLNLCMLLVNVSLWWPVWPLRYGALIISASATFVFAACLAVGNVRLSEQLHYGYSADNVHVGFTLYNLFLFCGFALVSRVNARPAVLASQRNR